MDFTAFKEYGFIGLIVGVLFFIVWRLLVWVMAFVKDIIKDQKEERTAWLYRLEKQSDLINKILSSVDDHDKRADERGRFVRDEHKQMIEILGRINGYKNT